MAKFCVRCGSIVEPSTSSPLTRVATPSVGNPVATTSVRCLKCGDQNPSDCSFCTVCGASLKPISSPVFVSSTVTAFGAAVPSAKNEETVGEVQHVSATQQVADPLRGVGGWLLLFCVGLIFIAPLYGAAEILENPTDVFVIVFDLSLAAFSIYTGITIWRIQPIALKLVKAYFIVSLVVACLAILGSFSADLKETQGKTTSPLVIGLRLLVYVAIWWSYFKKSARVKATFGSNL